MSWVSRAISLAGEGKGSSATQGDLVYFIGTSLSACVAFKNIFKGEKKLFLLICLNEKRV